MPWMDDSIAGATIIEWLKKVGDCIQRDQPIFGIIDRKGLRPRSHSES